MTFSSGEHATNGREFLPTSRLSNAVDRLSDRGTPVDWLPGLRATDECTPFIPIFPDDIDEVTARIFKGRIHGPDSTTVGYAIRRSPGAEAIEQQNPHALSDYAVLFATSHPNGTVSEVVFHVRGGAVWTREHLYGALSGSWFNGVEALGPTQQQQLGALEADLRMAIVGAELLEDYNWDWDISTIAGVYGVKLGPEVTDQMVAFLDTAMLPEMA